MLYEVITGPDNVFDFSLGNPDVPPPPEFRKVLRDLVNDESLRHGYTPNAGYPHVRQAIADYLSGVYQVKLTPDLIIITVGAAGALNDALNAVVNPGEEILVPSPYFIGYDHYAFVITSYSIHYTKLYECLFHNPGCITAMPARDWPPSGKNPRSTARPGSTF